MIANIPFTTTMHLILQERIEWLLAQRKYRKLADVHTLVNDIVRTHSLWELGQEDAEAELPTWGRWRPEKPEKPLLIPEFRIDRVCHVHLSLDVVGKTAMYKQILFIPDVVAIAKEYMRSIGTTYFEKYVQFILCRELRVPCDVRIRYFNAS